MIVDVAYHRELTDYPDEFLVDCVRDVLPVHAPRWVDLEDARLLVRPVAWPFCRRVLENDFVFIGSTRMMELVGGAHDYNVSHSLRARCRRAPGRPSYADHIYHASLVNWACLSPAARSARAKHFNTKVADAEGQLPSDRPGVDSTGRDADLLRHYNGYAASAFTTAHSLF